MERINYNIGCLFYGFCFDHHHKKRETTRIKTAHYYSNVEDFERAKKELELALKIKPNDTAALHLKASIE